MDFGLDRCAKAPFVRGRLQDSSSIQLNDETTIRDLENSKMKEKIRKDLREN